MSNEMHEVETLVIGESRRTVPGGWLYQLYNEDSGTVLHQSFVPAPPRLVRLEAEEGASLLGFNVSITPFKPAIRPEAPDEWEGDPRIDGDWSRVCLGYVSEYVKGTPEEVAKKLGLEIAE